MFLCCCALMFALIVTSLSWLSICCASQAFPHLCDTPAFVPKALQSLRQCYLFDHLCLLVSRCVHKSAQSTVCLVFLSQHRLRLRGGSTSPCRTALGTETSQARAVSPSHPGDRAGLVQGHGKGSALGGWVARTACAI